MKKFFTRTGDDGKTGILGEGRVEKFDPRMEALGALDELSSALGLARSLQKDEGIKEQIIAIQRKIYSLMAEVAASAENADTYTTITSQNILELEQEIDRLSIIVAIPDGFIVPGDSPASACIDLARTVTRRAERRIAELLDRGTLKNSFVLSYLNRLSSLLYVIELQVIQESETQKPTLAKEVKK